MLIVALTGGIATGKSVVAEVWSDLGCFIQHADLVAKELIDVEKPAWSHLVDRYGEKILQPDRNIDRRELARIIFSNDTEREYVNNLIHPLVHEEKQRTIKKLEGEGQYKIFISEAALTFEAGYPEFFDRIVVVHCKNDIQIARLMARDNIGQDKALLKIRSQMPQSVKIEKADYTIDTSDSIRKTIEQAEQTYRYLLWDADNKEMNNSI
ncbi:dephospho-CoA kinase [Acidobacteriota bacterium]